MRRDLGNKGWLQRHRGFVLFPPCCSAEAHIPPAVMIDSFSIGEGKCARVGNVCVFAHVDVCRSAPLLILSVLLLTPMCSVHARPKTDIREKRGSKRKTERQKKKCRAVTCSTLQLMHTKGLEAERKRENARG